MHLDGNAKIVIADDLAPMLVALRHALNQLGYANILEAANGTEAMAILENNPDTALIVSDWNMEPMDGMELLRAVRADRRFSSLPFVLVSADANQHMRAKAEAAGVSVVLAKPFDAEILRQAFAGIGVDYSSSDAGAL